MSPGETLARPGQDAEWRGPSGISSTSVWCMNVYPWIVLARTLKGLALLVRLTGVCYAWDSLDRPGQDVQK